MINFDNYTALQKLIHKFSLALQYADKTNDDCVYVHFTREELRETINKLQTI